MDMFCLLIPVVLYMKNLIARQLYCSQLVLCKWPKGRSLLLLLKADKRDRSNKLYDLLSLTINLGCGSGVPKHPSELFINPVNLKAVLVTAIGWMVWLGI